MTVTEAISHYGAWFWIVMDTLAAVALLLRAVHWYVNWRRKR